MENQKELRLSVSKLKTYLDCKAKYNFSYNLKLPKKEWGHLTLGKFCHKVLEDFHQFYIEGCELPYNEAMSQAFRNAKEEFKSETNKEMIKECWDMINQYLIKVSKEKKQFNVVSCEKKFDLIVGEGISLTGMIDKIEVDEHGIVKVCDYKTSKSMKYLGKDFFQLLTYAYVLLEENPDLEKVKGSYIMLRHNFQEISTEFAPKEIANVKQKYIDYGHQILNETEFEPHPTPLCNWCDYIDSCPAGKKRLAPEKVYGEVTW